MSFPPQTPPKTLPGAYIQTPALGRFQSGSATQAILQPSQPSSQQQYGSYTNNQAVSRPPQQQQVQTQQNTPIETLQPIERAAKNVSEILSQELQYPELDSYIGRGCSWKTKWDEANNFGRGSLI